MTDSIFIKGGFDLDALDKHMRHVGRTPDLTNGIHGESGNGMGKNAGGLSDGSGESFDGVPLGGKEGISEHATRRT